MKEAFLSLPLYQLLPVVGMLISLLVFLVSVERERHFCLVIDKLNNHIFIEPKFDEKGKIEGTEYQNIVEKLERARLLQTIWSAIRDATGYTSIVFTLWMILWAFL